MTWRAGTVAGNCSRVQARKNDRMDDHGRAGEDDGFGLEVVLGGRCSVMVKLKPGRVW